MAGERPNHPLQTTALIHEAYIRLIGWENVNAGSDADVAHAPAEYVVVWQRFDNATGTTTNLGETRASATNVNAPNDLPAATGTYIRVEISADGGPESWTEPAHAYFRREAAGWMLVGFERVPDGNPPGSKGASGRTN